MVATNQPVGGLDNDGPDTVAGNARQEGREARACVDPIGTAHCGIIKPIDYVVPRALSEPLDRNPLPAIQILAFADRFARDLMVQEVGFAMLRDLGVTLIAADSPSSFLDDGPTSKLIRQILGAVSEFDKAMTVAKLKGARDRVRRLNGKCEGRKSYAERDPQLVDMARWLRSNADGRPYSLRQVAAELAKYGYVTPSGQHYSASAVASML